MLTVKAFIADLRVRNRLLYINGVANMLLAMLMVILIFIDDRQILGIDPWIKPLKFFLSIAILSWTMSWLLWYLDAQKTVRIYSMLLVLTMLVEMAAICLQSYRGTTSHFNVSSPFNGIVFGIMGLAILTFTLATAVIFFLFCRQQKFKLRAEMVLSIRIGLFMFLLFSIEGFVMISMMQHSVGLKDGSTGIPFLNWSMNAGDLRVAHFFGMHALQVIPLVGHFLAAGKKQVILFSGLYFIWVVVLFIRAINGEPFF